MQNTAITNPPVALTGGATRLSWIAQLISAAILGQTLFFKFTAAPEAVALFETLGVEPWGRMLTGAMELIAVILLLIPRTAALGGLLSLGIISGAILSHLTVLGIEVGGDGGSLFGMAIVVFLASAVVTWLRRTELPIVGPRF